jgi:hypothetical protein
MVLLCALGRMLAPDALRGEANRINLSERTYSRAKDFFACEWRGKVLTKEKRALDMYFANGILPSLLDESQTVPPAAFLRRYNVYFHLFDIPRIDWTCRGQATGVS